MFYVLRYGRKNLCLVFTIVYSISCLMKLSRNYGVLIVARLFSAFATSLLFSAFEAWYMHEHIEKHDFPKEWIPVTTSKTSFWNGLLAILAGLIATLLAEWADFGPIAPFMCAIPCLLVTAVYIAIFWDENFSTQPASSMKKAFKAALREICTEPKIFVIGAIQSLFESVMYIFVFIWTPVLKPAEPPLGVVFSCFMICIMLGSSLSQVLTQKQMPATNQLGFAIAVALLANFVCVLATSATDPHHLMAFLAFLSFEVAVGVYYPTMNFLCARIIPEEHRRSIVNCFRLPLNLIACVVLMMLHNDAFLHGNRLIFVTCCALLGVAALLVAKLIAFTKDDVSVMQQRLAVDEEQIAPLR